MLGTQRSEKSLTRRRTGRGTVGIYEWFINNQRVCAVRASLNFPFMLYHPCYLVDSRLLPYFGRAPNGRYVSSPQICTLPIFSTREAPNLPCGLLIVLTMHLSDIGREEQPRCIWTIGSLRYAFVVMAFKSSTYCLSPVRLQHFNSFFRRIFPYNTHECLSIILVYFFFRDIHSLISRLVSSCDKGLRRQTERSAILINLSLYTSHYACRLLPIGFQLPFHNGMLTLCFPFSLLQPSVSLLFFLLAFASFHSPSPPFLNFFSLSILFSFSANPHIGVTPWALHPKLSHLPNLRRCQTQACSIPPPTARFLHLPRPCKPRMRLRIGSQRYLLTFD